MAALNTQFCGRWAQYAAWLLAVFGIGALLVPGGLAHLFDPASPYFDIEHYVFVSTEGYDVLRTAFFPGFPLLLKLLGGHLVLSAVVNILMASAALALLSDFTQNTWERALLVVQPVLCFWLIPYSEAGFFLCITVALLALRSRQLWVLAVALALAAFTRPVWAVMLPAFVWLFLVRRDTFGSKLLVASLVGLAVGTLGAFGVHAFYVGEWGSFFEAQALWGNTLAVPQLPLSTWSDSTVMVMDCGALTVGICAGVSVLKATHRRQGRSAFWWLGLLYLAGITALVLCFRGGGLFSLNRFVFATPFLGLALVYVSRTAVPNKRQFWWLAVPLCCMVLCGGYLHIQSMLNLLPVLLLGAVWLMCGWIPLPTKWRAISRIAFILSALLFQALMWTRVLCGEWVG